MRPFRVRLPEFAPPRPTLKGPAAAMDRDITCRVSGYMDGVEKAHLVPEGERLWFVSNKMDRYYTVFLCFFTLSRAWLYHISTDETDNSSVVGTAGGRSKYQRSTTTKTSSSSARTYIISSMPGVSLSCPSDLAPARPSLPNLSHTCCCRRARPNSWACTTTAHPS